MSAAPVSALPAAPPSLPSLPPARTSAFPASSMTSSASPRALAAAKLSTPASSPLRLSKSPPAPQADSHDVRMLSNSPKLPDAVRSTAGSSPVPPVAAGPSPKQHAAAATSPPPLSTASASSAATTAGPTASGGETPTQLALLLANALADADALRRELNSAQKRASRAERLLASIQGASPGSPGATATSAGAGVEPTKKERSERNGIEMSENAVKAILSAEARAERAERTREDLVHLLHTLTVNFTELERYEAACGLRAADARAAFARTVSSFASAHPPSGSPTLSGSSPRSDGFRDILNLPALPAPMGAPTSAMGASSLQLSGPGAHPSSASRYSRALPANGQHSHVFGATSSGHYRQNSAHTSAFHSLPLPPPPTASGLSAAGSSLHAGASATIPAKRVHRSRSGRGDELNGEWEDQKRRRVGGWEMDVDSQALSSPHPQVSPPYTHAHQPLSSHPTHHSQVGVPHSYERSLPTPTHHQQPPSQALSFGASSREGYAPTNAQAIYMRDSAPSVVSGPAGGVAAPILTGKYESRHGGAARYDERESMTREAMGRDFGRVDARELVRDAKERERRGREYLDAYPSHHAHSASRSHHASRTRHAGAGGQDGSGRRRSLSRSSAGSWSIDEMLLETATDRERERDGGRRRDDGKLSFPPLRRIVFDEWCSFV
ncbi:hypothetical protein M0805_001806 [Coniferiporia weirii]|nr:hypothetical protein M0805_001806 [Coniferiporia weirii]